MRETTHFVAIIPEKKPNISPGIPNIFIPIAPKNPDTPNLILSTLFLCCISAAFYNSTLASLTALYVS